MGSHILPELYYITTEPETIPFDTLPDRFVIKPTHGCGWVEAVTDKSKIDQEAIIRTCNNWLSQNFYKVNREWAYKDIRPRNIVEEFIDDGHGLSPIDYKLYVYEGETAFIQIHTGRFVTHLSDFYNLKWEKLPISLAEQNTNSILSRPTHFDEMLAAANALGKDMDFVRIDFYDTDNKLYIGEITTTPDAGMETF